MTNKPKKAIPRPNSIGNKNAEKHGYFGTRTYSSYSSMKARCNNPNYRSYKHYGAKGVKVCLAWGKDFKNFLTDLGERPEKTSLERKNGKLHYSCGKCEECRENDWPANCKWADDFEQNNNRSINVYLTCRGETHSVAEWTRIAGHKNHLLIYGRLGKGWPAEQAIFTPSRNFHKGNQRQK